MAAATTPATGTNGANGENGELEALVGRILDTAKRGGATAAEVSASSDTGLSVAVRKGELETVEFNSDRGFGVTVFVGQRCGHASTSDPSPEAIEDTVRAALDIARFTQADAHNGLADAELMARTLPPLDADHPWDIDVDAAAERARAIEAAALGVDARIVNSEGAHVSSSRGCRVYGNSHGFVAAHQCTRHAINCAVIAADDAGLHVDYDYDVSRDAADLADAEALGRRAGQRAIARLDRQPVATGAYPVLFEPRIAAGVIGCLLSALSGAALYRRESFLLDSLGRQVLPTDISLIERPHLPKALGSAAFDDDGVATRSKAFVQDGIVENYILGAYSSRRLGMTTTGNAGGVFNLDLEAPRQPVRELLQRMGTGLVVNSLMGQGVNLVTGDYSRGATGTWVVNGEPAHPVDEITIAANLSDMLRGIVGCGDDVDLRHNVRTGSLLVESMMVAA